MRRRFDVEHNLALPNDAPAGGQLLNLTHLNVLVVSDGAPPGVNADWPVQPLIVPAVPGRLFTPLRATARRLMLLPRIVVSQCASPSPRGGVERR